MKILPFELCKIQGFYSWYLYYLLPTPTVEIHTARFWNCQKLPMYGILPHLVKIKQVSGSTNFVLAPIDQSENFNLSYKKGKVPLLKKIKPG